MIKRQPKQVILAAFARMAERARAYIYLAFVFAYGTQVLHTPRDFLLTALITAGLVPFVTIPLAGHLSDRFGRKRIYLIGSVATGVFGFIYFAMLNTMVPAWIFLGIVLSFVPARPDVRSAGGIDRGMFHAAVALQRLVDRLSARLGDCRWAHAADRDGAACRDRIGLCDRCLYRVLRRGQHHRDGSDAGLHQPRHLTGARLGRLQSVSLKFSFRSVLASLDNERGAI